MLTASFLPPTFRLSKICPKLLKHLRAHSKRNSTGKCEACERVDTTRMAYIRKDKRVKTRAHDIWELDYDNTIIKLVGMKLLCEKCSVVLHMYPSEYTQEYHNAISKLTSVNNWSKE